MIYFQINKVKSWVLLLTVLVLLSGCSNCPQWGFCPEEGIVCREVDDLAPCCELKDKECLQNLECGYLCMQEDIEYAKKEINKKNMMEVIGDLS